MRGVRLMQPLLAVLRNPMTVGVRAILLDAAGRVVLVRHSYVPGWHLPGGGVDTGETIRAAMVREVREETGIAVTGEPVLLGLYLNEAMARRDHVAVFVVPDVGAMPTAGGGWEIVERGVFDPAALPDGTTGPTRARLAEALDGAARRETW